MTTMTDQTTTTQVYRVYIKATPQAIWDAITKPEWTDRYGYGGTVDYDFTPGAKYEVHAGTGMQAAGVTGPVVDGEIIEADEPRKLVQTWRLVMDDEMKAQGFTTLTYEIEEIEGGASKLTVTHDLAGAPGLARMVAGDLESTGAGGGWAWILSDLKSLLETGSTLAG